MLKLFPTPYGTFAVEVEHKRVKNVNLRVRRDGTVYLSAPPRFPEAEIAKFITREAGFLVRALKKNEAREERALTFSEGETFPLYGQTRAMRFEKGKAAVRLTEDSLVFTLPHPEDAAARRRAFEKWFRETADAYLSALSAKIRPLFREREPRLTFREMKSKWGVCRPKQDRITLNRRLLFVPPPLAEYVVFHEYAHFKHPNHSAAFHAHLASFLPDAGARSRALDRYPTPFVTERR